MRTAFELIYVLIMTGVCVNTLHYATLFFNIESLGYTVKLQRCHHGNGWDGIVAELLKSGGEEIIDQLLEILQVVWRTGQVPSER